MNEGSARGGSILDRAFRSIGDNTPQRKPDGSGLGKSPASKLAGGAAAPPAASADAFDKENCWVDAHEYLASNLTAIPEEPPAGGAPGASAVKARNGDAAAGQLSKAAEYNQKRLSFANNRRQSLNNSEAMTKLQSEYEQLQAKLSQLKSSSSRLEAAAVDPNRRATFMPQPTRALAGAGAAGEPLDRRASALPSGARPQLSQMDVLELLPPSSSSGGVGNSTVNLLSAGLLGDVGKAERVFTFPDNVAASRVGKAAVELFEEEELQKICRQGLYAQLTRTTAGATDASRIQELAGTYVCGQQREGERW